MTQPTKQPDQPPPDLITQIRDTGQQDAAIEAALNAMWTIHATRFDPTGPDTYYAGVIAMGTAIRTAITNTLTDQPGE